MSEVMVAIQGKIKISFYNRLVLETILLGDRHYQNKAMTGWPNGLDMYGLKIYFIY